MPSGFPPLFRTVITTVPVGRLAVTVDGLPVTVTGESVLLWPDLVATTCVVGAGGGRPEKVTLPLAGVVSVWLTPRDTLVTCTVAPLTATPAQRT